MDATQMLWRRFRRPQFSLAALLVLTALACFAAAAYGWRLRREEQLVRLVDQFNQAIDDREFERALLIAERAVRDYPSERVAAFMLDKARVGHDISVGNPLSAGSFLGCQPICDSAPSYPDEQ